MQVYVKDKGIGDIEDEMLVLPFTKEDIDAMKGTTPNEELDKQIKKVIDAGDFKGEENSTCTFLNSSTIKAKRIMLAGFGEEEKLSSETIRRVYAAVVKKAKDVRAMSFTLLFPETEKLTDKQAMESITEGIVLGNYDFDKYKSDDKENPKATIKSFTALYSGKHIDDVKKAAIFAYTACQGTLFVRDLVNENADVATPLELEHQAKEIAKEHKNIKIHVLDEKDLKKKGMNLLLAVGKGAATPPRLIILEYTGDENNTAKTAIVGKGITFDSGGLNLKPTKCIETMRMDMAGAATVLGTIKTLAELGMKVNVVGVVPACENAIGSKAYKPGDVYRAYNGKTVQIENTDAEGRLILADALAYTVDNITPDRIIDLATLTGACLVALGECYAGLLGTDDELCDMLFEAGNASGEHVWRLPIYDELKEELKGDVSDLKNIGGKWGGTISGACFLSHFVGKIPWAHLDIAGTAWYEKQRHYVPKFATGQGVRLLVEYFSRRQSSHE